MMFHMDNSVQTLQPIKASLIADLVDLININLTDLLRVKATMCPDCRGTGYAGSEGDTNSSATCATCGGIGAIEQFVIDHAALKTYRFGRLVEGFDVKHGILVPKMRSKDRAFAMLAKLLGFDKAIVEIANASPLTESLSQEQRAVYIEQLKELAASGLLDRS